MKNILVCGAGGFIGNHLVTRLVAQGHHVIGCDIKKPSWSDSQATQFHICDLRDKSAVDQLITSEIDEVYQLAADMGGAEYVFSGMHDADIMHNSAQINLNVLDLVHRRGIPKIFYSSSACIYPEYNQMDPDNPNCREESAYPAQPDSEYGWEKLFSERLYLAYQRNHGLGVRIARFHNVFGPMGEWDNRKAKAPAAICRKIAQSDGEIEVFGDGNQTRSFLYIEDALDGIQRLMASEHCQPINIGSDRMVSINALVDIVAGIASKSIRVRHTPGPLGVRGRNSDNTNILQVLGWKPADNLELGLRETYAWITNQLRH